MTNVTINLQQMTDMTKPANILPIDMVVIILTMKMIIVAIY